MRKQLIIFTTLIFLIGCSDSSSNQKDIQISILAQNPHPYLIDHDRVCVISRGDQEVTRFDLHPDTGTGLAISNLYELPETDQLLLIDKNGTWFFIDDNTGAVVKEEWNWLKKTPENYLGTFRYQQDSRAYFLTDGIKNTEPDIYLVKDPATQ